jgi:hypothetical protein
MTWRGARRNPELGSVAATLAAIGFIGVARWVSYPFVPARLLFVLPFFLLLVAQGAATSRRWSDLAIGVMLLLSISGIWCYFHKTGFRNKQYPLPLQQIADRILRDSRAGDSAILVDSTNSDPIALLYGLNRRRPYLETARPETPAELTRILDDPRVRTIWFLRNTHDVSPAGLNFQFETQLRTRMGEAVHSYEPYTPLEHFLMGSHAPRYFHELLEFRR